MGLRVECFGLQRCGHMRHVAIHEVMRRLGQFKLTGRVRYQFTRVDHAISCCVHSIVRCFDTHKLPMRVLEYKHVL